MITGPRCERCGAPGWAGTCPTCQEKTPAFTSVTAPFFYDGITRRLILNLKYRNMPDIGPVLADAALAQMPSWNCRYDALCEVPMHRAAQRKRGYNQSRILAERFAERLNLPLAAVGTLTKTRRTPHQAAQDVTTRWENVKDAFAADPEQVKGRSILIVDDVCTTGATLHFCAEALLSAGAKEAGCLTLARTDLRQRP